MDSEKNQHEDLKQWLRRYQDLQRDADRLWERLDELRGRIQGARTANLDIVTTSAFRSSVNNIHQRKTDSAAQSTQEKLNAV